MAHLVKNLPAVRQTWVLSWGWEDPLKKGKATHSSILAWRIPLTIDDFQDVFLLCVCVLRALSMRSIYCMKFSVHNVILFSVDIVIHQISNAIMKYNPNLYGYQWDLDASPSFQMEP